MTIAPQFNVQRITVLNSILIAHDGGIGRPADDSSIQEENHK